MKGSKLFDLLEQLSKTEFNGFHQYVQHPVFNKHEKLGMIMDHLANQYPDLEDFALTKQHLFELIYPGSKYNDLKVRRLLSYLLKMLEDYLAIMRLQGTPFLKDRFLLAEMRERGLNKHFQKYLKPVKAAYTDHPYRDEWFYYNRYLLENEVDQFNLQRGRSSKQDNLQQKVDDLDLFYLAAKLKNACEMINRQNIVAVKYRFHLLDHLMEYVKANYAQYAQTPAIALYYQILLTLRESDQEQHYERLKQLLAQHYTLFSPPEAASLYGYAQNYCIKKINSGHTKYLYEYFELYRFLLDTKIMLHNGYLHESHYKNVVSVGLRIKEFDWIHNFIETYKDSIPAKQRKNAYTYNLAVYYFERRDFDKAMSLLLSVEFTDVFYNLGSKTMLLKIYFEKQEDEAFMALLDTFRIYLQRNKQISEQQQRAYLNMLKYAKTLYKLTLKTDLFQQQTPSKKVKALTEQIRSTPQLANKEWLMERLDAL